MNRFMYLSKRNFSTQGIKSLYPKCIDCINFTEKTQTCKKFVTTENYIHHDSSNEFALNVRNDDSKCGKAGNLFDIGKEKLEEDNIHVLNVFCGWTLATSVLAFVTQSFEVIFIPATISFFTGIIYFVDYHDYHKKMNNEKKRLENIKQFHNK